MAVPMGSAAQVVSVRSFECCAALFRVAGIALCDINMFDYVSIVALASLALDESDFSWQAQHPGDIHVHFAWQAQHFRRVKWGYESHIICQARHFMTCAEN